MLAGTHNSGRSGRASGGLGRAAITAVAVFLCVPLLWARGPHQRGTARVAAHDSGVHYPGPPYLGPDHFRPAYPGYKPPAEVPRGHLGDWLNRHRGLPVQQQEQMLRSDPSFLRLAPAEQQRIVSQLRQVDRLTPQQQERRAARVELLEHMSPQERIEVSLSARRWSTLPVDRQALMKRAFRDLRAVPPEQRDTVLNSAGFQAAFSPEERQILSDLLRVEPYEPAPYQPAR